jgi:methionyl-tRNA synthetase
VALDAVRYYMLREVTFGLDGVFSIDSLIERFNADLANDLGNLLNRSLPLVHRWFEGRIGAVPPDGGDLAQAVGGAREACELAMEACDFRRALEALWGVVGAANKFLDEKAPWSLHRKGETEAAAAVLYTVLDVARCAAIGVAPFMPVVAAEMWRQLGLEAAAVTMGWGDFAAGLLPAGLQVGQPRPIFPRVDIARLQKGEEQKAAEAPEGPDAPAAAGQATVSYQEFSRLDLRAGRVLSAEPIAGAAKLLKLAVDIGESQPRQVVAGLAEVFGPDDLVGKLVVVIANLEPATIRGVESRGMLLAAGEDAPVALVVLAQDCPPGTKVR